MQIVKVHLLFLILFIPIFLKAQDSILPEPAPATPPSRVFFTVYIWPTTGILIEESEMPVIPEAYYDSPTGMQRVMLNRATMSSVYEYIGQSPLVLYEVERSLVPPPEEALEGTPPTVSTKKRPIIKADFPQDATRMNLIAFPSKIQSDGTMLTFPMPILSERLKEGEATIYNAANFTVVMRDREQTKLLKLNPYQTSKLPDEWHGSAPDRIEVFRLSKTGQQELVSRTRIRSQEDKINLFFLYPKNDRHMRILNVGSQLPDPPPLTRP